MTRSRWISGYGIIWGERISRQERGLYAAGLLFGSGSMYRHGLGFAAESGFIEYRAAQKITKGKNHAIEADHILGRRFYRMLGRESEIRTAPSEVLERADHIARTNDVRHALPHGRYDYTVDDIWAGYQVAYANRPDLLEIVNRELFR